MMITHDEQPSRSQSPHTHSDIKRLQRLQYVSMCQGQRILLKPVACVSLRSMSMMFLYTHTERFQIRNIWNFKIDIHVHALTKGNENRHHSVCIIAKKSSSMYHFSRIFMTTMIFHNPQRQYRSILIRLARLPYKGQ